MRYKALALESVPKFAIILFYRPDPSFFLFFFYDPSFFYHEAMTRLSLSLFVFVFLALQAGSLAIEVENGYEPIPLRDPQPGEGRPYWWLQCCADNVVVVEGTIDFTETKEDSITVKTSEALKKVFGDQRLFYIGHLAIEKVLFAAPGIESSNGDVNAMISGELQKTKVLITTYPNAIGPIVVDLAPGKAKKGVLILRYDSSVSTLAPVFGGRIPSEGIEDALKVFAYRKRFGHLPSAFPDDYFR